MHHITMMKLRSVFIILLLVASLFFADKGMTKVIDEHIYIIPMGQIDKNVMEGIKNSLPDHMPMSVKIEIDQQKELPQVSYDPSRRQYNAEAILDEIAQHSTIDTTTERALIITDADLYAPDSDFVLGFADSKKGICIVSLARLKNEFYGLKQDNKLFIERALKEAIYEFGVSRGLSKCPDTRCVMHFSKNLTDIDNKKNTFCRKCKDELLHQYMSPLIKASLKPLI